MNRRIFMWLASLAPALLGAGKCFARRELVEVKKTEFVDISPTKKTGDDGVLTKEWFGRSIELFRHTFGGYAQASVAGPYWFSLRINVYDFLQYTKGGNSISSEDYSVCKFTFKEISGFLTGTVTGTWGCAEDVDLDRHPMELMDYFDGAVKIWRLEGDNFIVGINKKKLIEYRFNKYKEVKEDGVISLYEWVKFTTADLVGGLAGELNEELLMTSVLV